MHANEIEENFTYRRPKNQNIMSFISQNVKCVKCHLRKIYDGFQPHANLARPLLNVRLSKVYLYILVLV